MKAKLVIVGGDAKKSEIDLRLPATIGRGREASLTLPHPLVSRLHCELYESAGRLFVRDLGSLNGTFVNNQRIDGEAELPVSQLLTIGTVTFRAVYEADGMLHPSTPDAKPEDTQVPTVADVPKTANETVSEFDNAPVEKTVQIAPGEDVDGPAIAEPAEPEATVPEATDTEFDDDFDGFDDLDFDEIDELGEDEEYHEEIEQQQAQAAASAESSNEPSASQLAQPLTETPSAASEAGSLDEPAEPAAAPAVPNPASPLPAPTPPAMAKPAAALPTQPQTGLPPAAPQLPNPTPPTQPQTLPTPAAPVAGETPSAEAIGPVAETSQNDAEAEDDDDALNAFLNGLD